MKVVKVAILTLCFARDGNYGATLQAYALKTYIEQQGHQAHIVSFKDSDSKTWIITRYKSSTRRFKNKRGILIRLKRVHRAIKAVTDSFKHFYMKKHTRRYHAFDSFIQKYCCEGEPALSINEIKQGKLSDDLIIVGSDWVWSLNWKNRDYIATDLSEQIQGLFFGLFPLRKGQHRVTYAASQGRVPSDGYDPKFYQKIAKNFELISVRESQSVTFLKDKCDLECAVEHVVDPTLLLQAEDYARLITDMPPLPHNEFVLIYALPAPDNRGIETLIDKIKSQHPAITLIAINKRSEFSHDGVTSIGDSCGPREFLHYVKNAKFIITNSFHGMVFASFFHVNFIAFKRQDNDYRQENLAISLGFEDRLLSANAECSLEHCTAPIDFTKVDKVREQLIKPSYSFLEHALRLGDER